MTYPTAIVIAGVLVAGAIFASGYSAQSAGGESGRYRLYPESSGIGAFMLCDLLNRVFGVSKSRAVPGDAARDLTGRALSWKQNDWPPDSVGDLSDPGPE